MNTIQSCFLLMMLFLSSCGAPIVNAEEPPSTGSTQDAKAQTSFQGENLLKAYGCPNQFDDIPLCAQIFWFDDAGKAALRRTRRILVKPVRRAVRRDDPRFVGHAEILQDAGGMAHGLPVGLAAHDDPDEGLLRHLPCTPDGPAGAGKGRSIGEPRAAREGAQAPRIPPPKSRSVCAMARCEIQFRPGTG